MAWNLLPVNYTDAVWSGLKKYNSITNDDGTVSFQDVTAYSNKENSFFGAKDANQMNEALNIIMSMVENGTDLYTAFQQYFDTQKGLFESTANATQQGFNDYVAGLKVEGDKAIETIKTDYRTEVTDFENQQEQLFTMWFDMMKDQLSKDAAGNLLNMINGLEASKAGQAKIFTVTVPANGWSDVAPYSQTIVVEGILDEGYPKYYLNPDTDVISQTKDFENITNLAVGNGSITIEANTFKPVKDLNIKVEVTF